MLCCRFMLNLYLYWLESNVISRCRAAGDAASAIVIQQTAALAERLGRDAFMDFYSFFTSVTSTIVPGCFF